MLLLVLDGYALCVTSCVMTPGLWCAVVCYLQVEIDPQLKELLEGPFRNLDCFREEQGRRRAAQQEVS